MTDATKESKEKCRVDDFSKLDIRDGVIHYKLYRQDGGFQEMTCVDSYHNRMFVSWVQIFDRYGASDQLARSEAEAEEVA